MSPKSTDTTAGTWEPGSAAGGMAVAGGMQPEPFLDWQAVWPGTSGYEPDGRAYLAGAPRGVRLAVQQAGKSARLIEFDRPWEQRRPTYPCVVQHDGAYHLWYGIGTSEQYPHGALCYAHSDDGLSWHRPELDLFPYGDHRKTNIVYPNRLEGSVFRDPRDGDFKLVTMESRWRYGDQVLSGDAEALPLRTRLREQGMPDRELRELLRLTGELRGASSPDGIHWTRLDATLMDRFCDTQNVALYDEERRRYVAYVRMSRGFRRAVGRSESPEFATEWPEPQVVLEADPQDPPTDDLYTNGYSRYPGGGPFHLMFPAVYYRTRDVLDVHLAVSRDGVLWHRPERTPIIPMGPAGGPEDSGMYASPGVIPLAGGLWGVLCRGIRSRHNEGYAGLETERGAVLRWATWQPDRLVALQADTDGELTLGPRECAGRELRLNYRTEPNGWIKTELIPPTLWPAEHLAPLSGHSFAECAPLRGDSLSAPVAWNGRSDLAALRDERIAIRIRMSRAKLFSVAC